MPDDDQPTTAERMLTSFVNAIPHVVELGIETVHVARGMAIMRLPYQDRLVGNPENGVLHGGAVTTLIDTVCGLACVTAPEQPAPVATLDLRIDYLRPATPKRDLFGRAEVYKLTRKIVFVKSVAYQDDLQDPVASATGTFMFTGRGGRRRNGKKAQAKTGRTPSQ